MDVCDVARCLATGGQRLLCDGVDEEYPHAEHDCGGDVWTGRWPGRAECEEFGWWARFEPGLGWVPCNKDDPAARPDLNRLVFHATWDAKAARWQRNDEGDPR